MEGVKRLIFLRIDEKRRAAGTPKIGYLLQLIEFYYDKILRNSSKSFGDIEILLTSLDLTLDKKYMLEKKRIKHINDAKTCCKRRYNANTLLDYETFFDF